MRVTLESTDKIVHLDGVPARLWEGHTASGIQVHAYITRIAVNKDDDVSQFDRELEACRPPRPELDAIPLRMVL